MNKTFNRLTTTSFLLTVLFLSSCASHYSSPTPSKPGEVASPDQSALHSSYKRTYLSGPLLSDAPAGELYFDENCNCLMSQRGRVLPTLTAISNSFDDIRAEAYGNRIDFKERQSFRDINYHGKPHMVKHMVKRQDSHLVNSRKGYIHEIKSGKGYRSRTPALLDPETWLPPVIDHRND